MKKNLVSELTDQLHLHRDNYFPWVYTFKKAQDVWINYMQIFKNVHEAKILNPFSVNLKWGQ